MSGALALVHPLQRELFAEIYQDRGAELPGDAAAMEGFEIDSVRERSAIVRAHVSVGEGAAQRTLAFPIHLLRAEDGVWQIADY